MFHFIFLFVIFLASANVLAEDEGKECMKVLTYVNRIHSCCDDPNVERVLPQNVHVPTDFGELTCEKCENLSKTYGYWKDGEVDKDGYKKLLEGFMEKYPQHNELLKPIKETCMGSGYEDSFPSEECSVRKFYACLIGITLNYCKTWKTTDECKDLSGIKDSCNKVLV